VTQDEINIVSNIFNHKLMKYKRQFTDGTVLHEFSKNQIELIDSIFTKVSFFSNIFISKRIEVYRQSELFVYQKNHMIYREGDDNDFTYIIIQGEISLIKVSCID